MAKVHPGRVWRISPSDLFLYACCRRCFWLKVVRRLGRPRSAFPRVFGVLDRCTKDHLCSRPSQEIAPGIRPGHVLCRDRGVRSAPLAVTGHASRVRLVGRLDTALAFDDGTFGVIDFKTTMPNGSTSWTYSDQLQAYALALENPDASALGIGPVTDLGLVCVEPLEMVGEGEDVAYRCVPTWIEIERDDERFRDLLAQVLLVLELEEPPEAAPGCPYCEYVLQAALVVLEQLQHED